MKKQIEDLKAKSRKELETEINKTIEEIARLTVESKLENQKDTNLIMKKKKYVAQLKTVVNSIKE